MRGARGRDRPPAAPPQGFESVIDLPLSEDWLPPPGSAAEQELIHMGGAGVVTDAAPAGGPR